MGAADWKSLLFQEQEHLESEISRIEATLCHSDGGWDLRQVLLGLRNEHERLMRKIEKVLKEIEGQGRHTSALSTPSRLSIQHLPTSSPLPSDYTLDSLVRRVQEAIDPSPSSPSPPSPQQPNPEMSFATADYLRRYGLEITTTTPVKSSSRSPLSTVQRPWDHQPPIRSDNFDQENLSGSLLLNTPSSAHQSVRKPSNGFAGKKLLDEDQVRRLPKLQ